MPSHRLRGRHVDGRRELVGPGGQPPLRGRRAVPRQRLGTPAAATALSIDTTPGTPLDVPTPVADDKRRTSPRSDLNARAPRRPVPVHPKAARRETRGLPAFAACSGARGTRANVRSPSRRRPAPAGSSSCRRSRAGGTRPSARAPSCSRSAVDCACCRRGWPPPAPARPAAARSVGHLVRPRQVALGAAAGLGADADRVALVLGVALGIADQLDDAGMQRHGPRLGLGGGRRGRGAVDGGGAAGDCQQRCGDEGRAGNRGSDEEVHRAMLAHRRGAGNSVNLASTVE